MSVSPPASPRSILKRQPQMNPLRVPDGSTRQNASKSSTSPTSPGAVRFAVAQQPERPLRHKARFNASSPIPNVKARLPALQIGFDANDAPHDCNGDWLERLQSPRPADADGPDDDVDRQLLGFNAVCHALGSPTATREPMEYHGISYPDNNSASVTRTKSAVDFNTARRTSDESLRTMISSGRTEDEEEGTDSPRYFTKPLSSPRLLPHRMVDDDVIESSDSTDSDPSLASTPILSRSLSLSSGSSSDGPASPADDSPYLASQLPQLAFKSPKPVYRENVRRGEEGRLAHRRC